MSNGVPLRGPEAGLSREVPREPGVASWLGLRSSTSPEPPPPPPGRCRASAGGRDACFPPLRPRPPGHASGTAPQAGGARGHGRQRAPQAPGGPAPRLARTPGPSSSVLQLRLPGPENAAQMDGEAGERPQEAREGPAAPPRVGGVKTPATTASRARSDSQAAGAEGRPQNAPGAEQPRAGAVPPRLGPLCVCVGGGGPLQRSLPPSGPCMCACAVGGPPAAPLALGPLCACAVCGGSACSGPSRPRTPTCACARARCGGGCLQRPLPPSSQEPGLRQRVSAPEVRPVPKRRPQSPRPPRGRGNQQHPRSRCAVVGEPPRPGCWDPMPSELRRSRPRVGPVPLGREVPGGPGSHRGRAAAQPEEPGPALEGSEGQAVGEEQV
uniref:basic salivary proline-rich protein 1-like n=1 Tax=Nyctereutes procyonoides TaxID=34880 RepID=UPI0024441EE2|nr:basic salivary proline-rich protein 1-like [Nyctereutes procyonoides]